MEGEGPLPDGLRTDGDLDLFKRTVEETVRETLLQLQAVPPPVTRSPRSQRRVDMQDWAHHGRVLLALDHDHAEGWSGQPAPNCMKCTRVAAVLRDLVGDEEDLPEDTDAGMDEDIHDTSMGGEAV